MSYPSTHTYETVYVLKSGISDADAQTIHSKIDNVIAKFQGKVLHRDDWGLQQLAYQIEKDVNGKYSLVLYSGNSGVVEEIERHFKILGDVVRFITVATEPDYNYDNIKKQIALGEEEQRRNREFREQRKAQRGAF